MKNKKGEVATLLTLGLVLVGTLITIGTSLFVSNKNTNLASNPRAAETCTTGFYASKGDPLVSGSGCAPVCGSDCKECNWNGDTKWQCKTAATGGSGVPACTKARTYASLTNCKAEHPGSDGDANCKQCLLGQTNRVEYGGTGPPAGGSEKVKNACEEKGGTCNFYADCNYGSYGGKADEYCSDQNGSDMMKCCKPKGSGGGSGSMTNNLCTKASTSNSTNTCVKKTGKATNDSFCRSKDYNGGWSNWTCIEGDPSAVCCSKLNVGGSGGGGGGGDKTCGDYDGDCMFGDNTTTKGPLDCGYFASSGNDTTGCNPIPTTGDCSSFSARQCHYVSYCNYDSKNKKCVAVESNPPAGGSGKIFYDRIQCMDYVDYGNTIVDIFADLYRDTDCDSTPDLTSDGICWSSATSNSSTFKEFIDTNCPAPPAGGENEPLIVDNSCHEQNCSNIQSLKFAYKCNSYQNVNGVPSCNGTTYYKSLADCTSTSYTYIGKYESEELACGKQYTNISISVSFNINNNLGAYDDKATLTIYNEEVDYFDTHDFKLSNLNNTPYTINGPTSGLACTFGYKDGKHSKKEIPCEINISGNKAEINISN